MNIWEWLRAFILALAGSLGTWLPVSASGHLLVLERLLPTGAGALFTADFMLLFSGVLELAAMLAVLILHFYKLNPLSEEKNKQQRKAALTIWQKLLIGTVPACLGGLVIAVFIGPPVFSLPVAAAVMIASGLALLIGQLRGRRIRASASRFFDMPWPTAFTAGLCQILAIFPGTSRMGLAATMAQLFGAGRALSAEFAVYTAIPTLFAAGIAKVMFFLARGNVLEAEQFFVLLLGLGVSFFVSLALVRRILAYMKRHTLNLFALYRMAFGMAALVAWFLLG